MIKFWFFFARKIWLYHEILCHFRRGPPHHPRDFAFSMLIYYGRVEGAPPSWFCSFFMFISLKGVTFFAEGFLLWVKFSHFSPDGSWLSPGKPTIWRSKGGGFRVFAPPLATPLSKGLKAVKWTRIHGHSTKCRRWGKTIFFLYFTNRKNLIMVERSWQLSQWRS